MFRYKTSGVCSREIQIELDGDVIQDVKFIGGCNGNLKAISKLVKGKTVDEIVGILEGNTCGPKPTSCADQLAQALQEAKVAS